MSTQPTPVPNVKTLYVICHGALATLQTDQNLTIMIPNMGATHSYRAGSWLAETTIQEGSSNTLTNVTGGSATLPTLQGSNPKLSTAARPPFATFVLPLPLAVYPLFQATVSKDVLVAGPGATAPTADLVVPYIPVFEYSYTGTPLLGDVWPVAGDDLSGLADNPLTLHIFAEDEIPLDDGHAIEAFNLSCQLLGLNISLPSTLGPNAVTALPALPLPPGMENRRFEFQPLDLRREAFLAICVAKQNNLTIPDPWASLPTDLDQLAKLFFRNEPTSPTEASIEVAQGQGASCMNLMVGIGGKH